MNVKIDKKVVSSGGFIFYLDKISNEIFVVLIKNLKSEYWIPKGKIEFGEEQKDTAFREIREETGLKANQIKYVGFCFLDKYLYKEDSIIISKELYINIFSADKKYLLEPEDLNRISIIDWYRYKDALNLISFNKKELIDSYDIFIKFSSI